MMLTSVVRDKIRNVLNIVKVLGGMVLLVAVSWEIIGGDHLRFSKHYLDLQFVVCLLFLCDFLVNWAAADRPRNFFVSNFYVLLLSIPYLNILAWTGAEMPRYTAMLVATIPLLRAFLAFYILVRWFVGGRVQRLLAGYIVTLIVFTYLAALVFFDYELPVNDKLHGFGNALWWACMNVTTVGAEIFPVTAVGKVFAVLLPLLGMMMFPIITAFVMDEYSRRKNKKSGD